MSMLMGASERVFVRDEDGSKYLSCISKSCLCMTFVDPLIVHRTSARAFLQFPRFTVLAAVVIPIVAFFYRSTLAIGLLCGAGTHFFISRPPNSKLVSFKCFSVIALLMV